jgi:hypothetical protein
MPSITAPFVGQNTEFHITDAISGTISASTKVGEVDDLGSLELSRNTVDLLSYGDDDLRKLVTAKDNGSLSVTLNWSPADTEHGALATAFVDGTIGTYAIQWVSGASSARADFSAFVSSYGIAHPKDDKVSCTVELTLSGAVTFDLTPA